MSSPLPKLWIEVDDLFHYLAHHSRPSGIQRVTFEICQALHHLDSGVGRVGFVRRGDDPHDMMTVDWERLNALFKLAADPDGEMASSSILPLSETAITPKPLLNSVSVVVPTIVSSRDILVAALTTQGHALLELAKLPIVIGAHVAGSFQRRFRTRRTAKRLAAERTVISEMQLATPDGMSLQEIAAPGDNLIVLGTPWTRRDYSRTVRWVRDDLRMRFALLIYDVIPVRRPEWCHPGVIELFIDWHQSVLPLADQIFSISHATADDVTGWACEAGFAITNEVRPVPMGTGFKLEGESAGPRSVSYLPEPGSYALFVSTLEARKNHVLLFRVWRRLLAELPRERVPTLVFAGRVGWLVVDLLQQLENTNWLDGKIRLLRDPTDAELTALYGGCQFTLFPSLFEGWGLPISESLALGRPCIASNSTSLPEAGGDLARYFDPENLDDAYRTVRAVIEDPADLEAWRQRVVREFRHVPWTRSAEVIRDALDALDSMEETKIDIFTRQRQIS